MPINVTSPQEMVVEAEGLTKIYERGERQTTALDGVSLSVRRGEIVGLLGPNGAGKTTILHTILGLIRPDAGRVTVFGASPLTQRTHVVSRLNFASAYADLPSNLTVAESLTVFAHLYGVRDHVRRLAALTEELALGPLQRKVIGKLSSGEQMRVKICKSLVNDPELLLLDEPTLSLDPYMSHRVRTLLAQVQRQRGLTVIHTSHNMAEVESFCHRIIFLHRGRVLAEGAPREVLAKFRSASLDELFIKVAEGGELLDVRDGAAA
jgi:ABC-2 type transport system ATP-binding protein